jgi:methionyl-tRNA synthetase
MATNKKFYVTTPIYYVNDKPHLGHVYTTMVADVVSRYHRLLGEQTFFLTGVDEHASKVSDKAAENNLTPKEWADQNADAFKAVFAKLEMTNSDFVRTSSDLHKAKVSEYVSALLKSGDVYQGEYIGWYDAGQEEYVPETKAKEYDYKSPVNGKPLVKKTEKNYFFKLSAYRDQLIAFFTHRDGAGKPFVMPQARKNEIINRIKEAMDVPISRTGSNGWGIPVPGDEEHTIYVWIDALFNYLTYMDSDDRRPFWESGPVHFMAKDILWFHAAIWPALLMALAKCEGYQWVFGPSVEKNIVVYSHSYWISATGEKMSKSLGNFLDPAAIDNYVGEFGLDALRYFLATRGPLGTTDSAFSPDLFADVYNSDLANTFGNSASRVTNMINKYFDGKCPEAAVKVETAFNYSHTAEQVLAKYIKAGNQLDLSNAADSALSLVRAVDSYIEETAPFKRAKDEEKLPEVATILYNCVEALRIVSVMLWPFIPDQCEVFWDRIGCPDYAKALKDGHGQLTAWAHWGQLKAGTDIQKGDPLFPRYLVK